MQAERTLISRVLQTGRIGQAISAGIEADHFHKHKQEWQYLTDFWMKHSEVPSVKVFCERFPDFRYGKSNKKNVRIRPAVDSVVDNHVAIELARMLKDATEQLDEMPASAILEEMNARMNTILRAQKGDEDVDVANDFDTDYSEFLRTIEANKTEQKAIIQSPWPVLNHYAGGFVPGTVTGILARPNVGKSWLIDQAAVHAGLQGHRVYIAPLEMNRRQTVARLHTIASFYMARKKGKRWAKPALPALLDDLVVESLMSKYTIFQNSHLSRQVEKVDAEAYLKFGRRFEKAMGAGFFMPNINRRSQGFTLESFITKLERTEAEIGFLDYFGLLDVVQQKGSSRWEGWSAMSQKLKIAAEHLNIPLVVAFQANRNGALTRTPELVDIADSDAIGRDLDVCLSLAKGDDGLSMTCIKLREGEKNWRASLHFYPDYGIVEQNMHAEVERHVL